MRGILIFLIRMYQYLISPILPRSCRYSPSCSEYAIEAFQIHGVPRGFVLTAWRILRCNPFLHGGYDPVPTKYGTREVCGLEERAHYE